MLVKLFKLLACRPTVGWLRNDQQRLPEIGKQYTVADSKAVQPTCGQTLSTKTSSKPHARLLHDPRFTLIADSGRRAPAPVTEARGGGPGDAGVPAISTTVHKGCRATGACSSKKD